MPTEISEPRPPESRRLQAQICLLPGTHSQCTRDRNREKDRGPERFACGLRDGVFGSLNRAALDDLASRLGLENRRLLREGIDALALFCGRLPHDYHAAEAGDDEDAVLLQLDVTDGGYGLDDSLHVLAGELVIELVGNLLDQIGLGQG